MIGAGDPSLIKTLAAVADAMSPALRPWWVIGSAAVALHGADAGKVGDVDILVDPSDADALFRRLGVAALDLLPHPLFRSERFARWAVHPLPVEMMAGFAIATTGGWQRLEPATRHGIAVDGRIIHVPAREELIAILGRIGRPKDVARAAALEGREPG